ncbi:MAG TPA: hypothetical protein VFN03_02880 [Trueperaceae bacterium]|nr:hypothetical protein [Trueperaceae bacterium]
MFKTYRTLRSVVTFEIVKPAFDADHGNIMHAGGDVLIGRTV